MVENIFYFVLAALGLGFLIFIHELGHYFMARRAQMKVEVFSIGFGKPFFSWQHQGVKWQLCILPFGGYVRIAGMEKKGSLEPHQIPDGFFGKRPIERIKVALMGPLVNIAFAFVIFALIWMSGGREKSFAEFTHYIGWLDPASKLYEKGVRPGDEITAYNHQPFQGGADLLFSALKKSGSADIEGYEIDYFKGVKKVFNYTLPTHRDARFDLPTVGLIMPASYLIYEPRAKKTNEEAPIQASGIEFGDRIVSVDGEIVFSLAQLVSIVNQPRALVSVARGETIFQTRLPRLKISDLILTDTIKMELQDWQHASHVKGKLAQLYFIPYNLSHQCIVENSLSYFNAEATEQTYASPARAVFADALQGGDRIIAVDGVSVNTAEELFNQLQTRRVHLVVEKQAAAPLVLWKDADKTFEASLHVSDLKAIIQSIGTSHVVTESGSLRLLAPIVPKSAVDYPLSAKTKAEYAERWELKKKQIEEIKDPKVRLEEMSRLEREQRRLFLGIDISALKDTSVIYNPSPITLFTDVLQQTWRTFSALLSGILNPKMLSGPVGIVQVMHHGWSQGINEALYWMGLISVNLGIFNLLPLPILDGGYIFIGLWEILTKKRVNPKLLERLLIPFMVLLIGFMLFLTYHDIIRIFSSVFR